jgi:MYST family zinc finger domain
MMPSARRMSVTPSVASTAATKPSTAERNIDNVVFGDMMFSAWYPSYHVKEIVGKEVVDGKKEMLERLYVCNHCFKYSKELMNWVGHVRVCERRFGGRLGVVPGQKIYTHGKGTWSVWEVDGEVDTVSNSSIIILHRC